jgi:hypothetical protein
MGIPKRKKTAKVIKKTGNAILLNLLLSEAQRILEHIVNDMQAHKTETQGDYDINIFQGDPHNAGKSYRFEQPVTRFQKNNAHKQKNQIGKLYNAKTSRPG